MLRLISCLILISLVTTSHAQNKEKEKAVRAYYSGFEKHDWNLATSQFDTGFTFTSPNNDNHISIEKFKEKCWGTNKFFKKVNYIKMAENGNELFLLVEIITTDNNIVRNVDVFKFSNADKIESIETFFGAGESYPGNKK